MPAVKARLKYAREELKFLVVVCCLVVVEEEEDGLVLPPLVLLLNLREVAVAASERCAVAVDDVARHISSLKR